MTKQPNHYFAGYLLDLENRLVRFKIELQELGVFINEIQDIHNILFNDALGILGLVDTDELYKLWVEKSNSLNGQEFVEYLLERMTERGGDDEASSGSSTDVSGNNRRK